VAGREEEERKVANCATAGSNGFRKKKVEITCITQKLRGEDRKMHGGKRL